MVAIEFALLFIPFFVVFYALVSYSLVLLVQGGLSSAAEDGARAALAVDPLSFSGTTQYQAAAASTAESAAMQSLNWLPSRVLNTITVSITPGNGGETVIVTCKYNANPWVPALIVPPFGQIPPLPAGLTGQAWIQL
ncbi:MAG: pilus assembly protein [Betaproteobacteria bacterium]|nr:pilus assembly protein [Betaproteobacteria bacterium]